MPKYRDMPEAGEQGNFWKWYESCRRQDGIHYLAETLPFAHDEAWYAGQFTSDAAMGKGAVHMLRHLGANDDRPALEIGCGAGALSYGLALHSRYPRLILTDPSVRFLEITRNQLAGLSLLVQPEYAVMSGEQVSLFPEGSLSLVLMRYTLHHIWDLENFFRACSRVLEPGGALLFEEPHASFFTHATAMMLFMKIVAEKKNMPLSAAVHEQVDLFLRTIENYIRQDIDKSRQEDKHLFGTETILDLAEKNGFRFLFVLNRNLASFADRLQSEHDNPLQHGAYDFFVALRYYLVEIMRFGEPFGALLDATLEPYCERFNAMFRGTPTPPNIIIGACLKR